ncbi:pleckstrin homology domain-containing family A member 3-like isoform X1 [Bufo gargarizans]|uniref:pleckstrin homology domain-containing family A member 3-like isoform X1 n=1 Tax=Bufo gargarizans TaxID=30331 RepID=UPI001CF1251B|nr:pleckstrin homology domain-containing family A member 3-like isoform X1 [Bufo gargarizans]
MKQLDMEGSLLKWTNYLSGWQPRYFVLDHGILSYYDSQDDVDKGSKGSIKMAVCEIRVHQADSCRMDLYIPKEQYFYLRSDNAADRQRWLVALGSAKACLGDSATQKSKDVLPDNESLSRKLSELRLFCDLLMGQVAEVKEAVTTDEAASVPNKEGFCRQIQSNKIVTGAPSLYSVCADQAPATSGPGKLNMACSNLQGTCSYICSTLDDCIKYVNTNLHKQDPPLPVLPGDVVGTKLPQSRKVKRSVSQPVESTPARTSNLPKQGDGVTVMKNLEQLAMRLRTQERQYVLSSNGTSG